MRAPTRLLAAATIVVAATTCLAVPADAAPASASAAVKHYANCAAVHRDFSGGIAKKGVRYNTVHSHGTVQHRKLKGHVKFSTALYQANKRLDRDHDGIACEKS